MKASTRRTCQPWDSPDLSEARPRSFHGVLRESKFHAVMASCRGFGKRIDEEHVPRLLFCLNGPREKTERLLVGALIVNISLESWVLWYDCEDGSAG